MNEFDVLLGFLNAAATIAGVTGVVALIDRRAAHTSYQVTSFRIRSLIGACLCVLLLSVLPIFLTAFKVPDHYGWRIACTVMAIVDLGCLVWVFLARSRLSGAANQGLKTSQLNLMTALGSLTILGLCVAAADGIPPMAMYLVGDFLSLLIAATVFLQFVLMLDESLKGRD